MGLAEKTFGSVGCAEKKRLGQWGLQEKKTKNKTKQKRLERWGVRKHTYSFKPSLRSKLKCL